MKKILSHIRRAIEDYNMIDDGDKIAVGISGGKDSLVLLKALKLLQAFYPKKFDIEAITVSMGFDNFDTSNIADFCDKLKVNYTIKSTDIKHIIFDIRKESNPCSLCANMRRGALNNAALSLACNKIALGHHKDDVIETLFLNMFFSGKMDCFSPVTYLDRKNVFLIRPMIYIPEVFITNFSERDSLPILRSPCPMNDNTKRNYIKNLLNDLSKENEGLKNKVFTAIQTSHLKGWNR